MFEWIKRVWPFSRKAPLEDYELYKPSERTLFRYWDGERIVNADPVALYKRLSDKGPELSTDMKLSQSMSKDAGMGHANVVRRVREIFHLRPLANEFEIPEGEGKGTLTDTEAVELLDAFLTYCGFVKKNSSPSPTPSTPTEGSPSSTPAASPPTGPSLASGSVESESKTDGPKPSPSG